MRMTNDPEDVDMQCTRSMASYGDAVDWLGVCEGCGGPGLRRRQNTAYNDDERNFQTLCVPCQIDADAHWDDMWADVRRGCM